MNASLFQRRIKFYNWLANYLNVNITDKITKAIPNSVNPLKDKYE